MIVMLLGTILFALPYEIVFIIIWIYTSIIYPFLYISILLPIILYPKATISKYQLILQSIQYILFSTDQKLKIVLKKNKHIVLDDPSIYFTEYLNQQQNHSKATTSTNDNNDKSSTKSTSKSTTTTTTTNTSNSSSSSKQKIINQKLIIFVRHGESTWNDTFNKGNDRTTINFIIYFIPNLIKTFCIEYYYYITGQYNQSYLYDAPLSQKGIQQAYTIQQYINTIQLQYITPKEYKFIQILKNYNTNNNTNDTNKNKKKPIFMVSNLRRAITTAAIAFYPHFIVSSSSSSSSSSDNNNKDSMNTTTKATNTKNTKLTNTKLMIVPALQEISTNPDALCITPPASTTMVCSNSDPYYIQKYIYNKNQNDHHTNQNDTNIIDTTLHTGNKSLYSTGLDRIPQFCSIVFHNDKNQNDTNRTDNNDTTKEEEEDNDNDDDAIIVIGHSLWFLSFFQYYLPHHNTHICKQKKLQNGSMIGFTLLHTTSTSTNENSNNKNENSTNNIQHHYMVDPTSLVVLHGGF